LRIAGRLNRPHAAARTINALKSEEPLMETTVSRVGRFERSFMFHMILDFFLLLVGVACIELAIRYAALRYDFSKHEPVRVERAAQQLANDVKSIMLNSGGPTAAATVYPILNRNYDDLGLSIAVVPAEVTIESMRATRNMEAHGLPARFGPGEHQQASTSLQAEQFCLGCHVKAKVGDVLGTVTVRSYLERKEDAWWQEARLTAGALSVKILAHTILLFLLLKVRMEPLLALRTTVSRLAKGVMDLSPRAGVKTDDEFGELALDLNHFLDRIGVVVVDLDKILSEVVSVGGRLGTLNRQLEKQLDGMRDSALRTLGDGAQRGLETQLVAARESGAFDVLAETLDTLAASGQVPAPTAVPLRDQVTRLRDSFARVTQALQQASPPILVAQAQSAEYQAFALSLREMAVLESTMQTVAESGQRLLQRISKGKNGSVD
jgi:methyl-accepting chemotaxis protein